MNRHQAHWKLPRGVARGTWDYVHNDHVAEDYDNYFAYNRLFEFDEQVVSNAIAQFGGRPGQRVADLGCGTGRALVPLARQGYQGMGVDLSQRMLDLLQEKADDGQLPITCLRANLVELDGLADACTDHAISLFSTLGMIQGRAHRQRALQHTHRILRPGGVFVLHVHNYWYNLYDPQGPWWVLRSWLRARLVRDLEAGDKYFTYRGVSNMFLHVFTRRELKRTLREAGFEIRQWIHLDPRRHQALPHAWLLPDLRANGWIIVCTKPPSHPSGRVGREAAGEGCSERQSP